MNLFDYNSPLMRFLDKTTKCVWTSVLFIVTCLPVFTIGTSVSALYYTSRKVLKDDLSYATKSYFHSFKSCFRQSTLFFLPVGAAAFLFFREAEMMKAIASAGHAVGSLYPLFYILAILLALYLMWGLAILARFQNTLRNTAKNALIMMVRNPATTLIMGLLMAFGVIVVYLIPILAVLMPAVIMWLVSYFTEKAFKKCIIEKEDKTCLTDF